MKAVTIWFVQTVKAYRLSHSTDLKEHLRPIADHPTNGKSSVGQPKKGPGLRTGKFGSLPKSAPVPSASARAVVKGYAGGVSLFCALCPSS